MTWWLVLLSVGTVALLGALAWPSTIGKRPAYYRYKSLESFEPALLQLAEVMSIGSVFIIEHEGSPRFIQFARRENCLRFGFPDAPWSREHFPSVEQTLAAAGFSTETHETRDATTRRFLHVDLTGSPAEIAAAAVRVSFHAAAATGLSENAPFRGHYQGDYDSQAYLSKYESQYEKLAQDGPIAARPLFWWHLRGLRRAAGQSGSSNDE